MRILFFILLLLPTQLWANGCDSDLNYSSKDLNIHISGLCGSSNDRIIAFTDKIEKSGQLNANSYSRHSYDFYKECSFSEDLVQTCRYGKCSYDYEQVNLGPTLTCHDKGHTPLAGATFKREQAGPYSQDCGDLGSFKIPNRVRYVCISGCNKSVPKFLDERPPCD